MKDPKSNQQVLVGAKLDHRITGWVLALEDAQILLALGLNPAHYRIESVAKPMEMVSFLVVER